MVIYLICQFLVIYFSVKKWLSVILYRVDNENRIDAWVETKEFWFMFLTILFWTVIIPSTICWLILDRITKNIYNKKQ